MSPPELTEDLLDLYENAPCGYLSLAPDSTIVRANRTLLEWIECPADSVIGQPLRELLGTGGMIAYETHISPLLRIQGFVYEIALDLRCGSELIPVIANASEKRDENDHHLFTRLTLFRAEDRRKYERNLLESKIRAEAETQRRERESQLREQFIAVLGHDLRNPVAALRSGVSILGRNNQLDERQSEVLEVMNNTLDRTVELIDNVMDFARGRLGSGISLELKSIADLADKLETVVKELQAAHPDREIECETCIDRVVVCDADRLAQLLSNLVSNALHHGTPDRPVLVKALTNEQSFMLSVANCGPPIPDEVRETLFEPFNRGLKKGNRGGLGLGLFIVDLVAKAHQGRTHVESDAECTTFTFAMPLAAKEVS